MATDNSKKYPFVHAHIAKEPYLFDILNEIEFYQGAYLKEGADTLATLDLLKNSKNIKMPVSPSRNKNIIYILELLLKTYPEYIKPILTFDFIVDPETKKLSINQIMEFTIFLTSDQFNEIQAKRDKKTLQSLSVLLKKFRLFNLTKLINKATNRVYLSGLIKSEIGKTIFTYKNSSIETGGLESTEDYCFYVDNYEAVRSSLKIENLQKIIITYQPQILNHLKRYGIFSADIGDYRDSKVDYILNILIQELSSTIGQRLLVEVKNFASLRECIMKVDKIIDPLITQGKDIVAFINEHDFCKWNDVVAVLNGISLSMLAEWSEKYAEKDKIFSFGYITGERFFVNGSALLAKLAAFHQEIILDRNLFATLSSSEKQKKLSQFDLYCYAGDSLVSNGNLALSILGSDESINKIKSIISDYTQYKNIKETPEKSRPQAKPVQTRSFIEAVIDFFKGLFSRGPVDEHENEDRDVSSDARPVKKKISKETVDLYKTIKSKNAPLLALSDFIEIIPDNDMQINNLINELRNNNLKIVIPIYNARTALYPNRSAHYLMSDIEYLLVDPKTTETTETINDFLDSITGKRIKEEKIPVSAIIAMEKYLMTLHRQKKTLDSIKKASKN